VENRERVLVVTGEGRAAATPDRCVLSLAVNVMRKTVAEAISEVTKIADQVVAEARDSGVDDAHIHTQTVTVQDFFDHQLQRITGRVATYVFTVSDRRLGEVGPLVGALTDVAGDTLRIQGIDLVVSDPAPHLAAARTAAVADARARAEQLAAAAGVQLGAILTIDEGSGGGWPRPIGIAVARTAMDTGPSLPIEAGGQSIVARVTMTFALDG
jgi:uncharacterized protein YggE